MRKSILVYTAAMAVMLFAAGCDKQEVKLAAPQPEYSVEAGTYTFTWAETDQCSGAASAA